MCSPSTVGLSSCDQQKPVSVTPAVFPVISALKVADTSRMSVGTFVFTISHTDVPPLTWKRMMPSCSMMFVTGTFTGSLFQLSELGVEVSVNSVLALVPG